MHGDGVRLFKSLGVASNVGFVRKAEASEVLTAESQALSLPSCRVRQIAEKIFANVFRLRIWMVLRPLRQGLWR